MSKAFLTVMASFVLCACSVLQGTPVSPPPPTERAQLINYAQTSTLTKIGTASVTVNGSPDDADRAIQRQADEKGAHYYTIVMKTEKRRLPGVWVSRAVLYR